MPEFLFHIYPLVILAIFAWRLYPFRPKINAIKAFYKNQNDPFTKKTSVGGIVYAILLTIGFLVNGVLITLQGFSEVNLNPYFIFNTSYLLIGTLAFWTWLLANICYQSWKGKMKQPIYYWIIALISWSMLLVFTIRQLFG